MTTEDPASNRSEEYLELPILITASLGLAYVLVTHFKRTYLQHFGVTDDLLDISIRDVLNIAPLLWIMFMVIAKITIGTQVRWLRRLYWDLSLLAFFMIMLLDAKIGWIAWVSILVVSLAMLAWNARIDRKEDRDGVPSKSWHLLEFAEGMFGPKATSALALFITVYSMGFGFALAAGKITARRQASFLTTELPGSREKCAVVGNFQGALICVQYEPQWKMLSRKYRLIPISQDITLRREELGAFKYWWLY